MTNATKARHGGGEMNPLKRIVKQFQSYYHYQGYENDNDMDKDETYWAAVWQEFLEKEGVETFIPYIYKTGCLYPRLWETYKLKGNIPFDEAEALSGNLGWGEMDWLDTLLNQPQFVGKHKRLANGATLQEFLDCIQMQFSGEDYNPLFQTVDYWVDYWGYDEEDAQELVKDWK